MMYIHLCSLGALALLCGIVRACVNAAEGIVRARSSLCRWASAVEFPRISYKESDCCGPKAPNAAFAVVLSVTAKIRFLCKLLRNATVIHGTRKSFHMLAFTTNNVFHYAISIYIQYPMHNSSF